MSLMNKNNSIKCILAMFIISFIISPFNVYALPSIDQQIKEIESKIKENKQTVNDKKAEAANLQSQVSAMSDQINVAQANINSLSHAISDQEKEIGTLKEKIKINEEKITQNKSDLKKLIQLLYEKGNLSAMEILASTSSITNFLNQEEYNRAVQDKINSTIQEIKILKNQLEAQKKEEETKKLNLETQRSVLEKEKKNQQYQKFLKDDLLKQTKGQQAEYEKMLAENNRIAGALYEERERQSRQNNEWFGGGGNDYPYLSRGVDPWGFYKLQCTSYAAWKWNVVYDKPWYRGSGPSGTGDAHNWPNLAIDQGYHVRYSPQVGDIVVWPKTKLTPYGHVAIVERVNSDGTIEVSEYNWKKPESYTYRGNILSSGLTFIY